MGSARTRAGHKTESVGVQPPSRAERYAAGEALRASCPRESHARWKAPSSRRDAFELVLAAEKGREPDLLPLRHGRMARPAFSFYRGRPSRWQAAWSPIPRLDLVSDFLFGNRINKDGRKGGSSQLQLGHELQVLARQA